MKKILFWGIGSQYRIMREIATTPIPYNTEPYIPSILVGYNVAPKPEYKEQLCYNEQEFMNIFNSLFITTTTKFCVTIAGIYGKRRTELSEFLENHKMKPASLAHSTRMTEKSVHFTKGEQISQGVIIAVNCYIGPWAVLAQNANIEHDCYLGKGVTLAASACLCGNVTIGDYVFIGANATIINDVKIGEGAIIGAGSVVLHDIPPYETWVGNPASFLKKNEL